MVRGVEVWAGVAGVQYGQVAPAPALSLAALRLEAVVTAALLVLKLRIDKYFSMVKIIDYIDANTFLYP